MNPVAMSSVIINPEVCDLCQTQEICNKVIGKDSIMFKFVSNHFKTQEMRERAFKLFFYAFSYILDQYKTQQMRESIILKDPENLQVVPNHFDSRNKWRSCIKGSLMQCHILWIV